MSRTNHRRWATTYCRCLVFATIATFQGPELVRGQAPAAAATTSVGGGNNTPPLALQPDQPVSGIIYRGTPEQIAHVNAQMREYLAGLNCPTHLVLVTEPLSGGHIAYTLNTATVDSDTLTLAGRMGWDMSLQTVAFHDRNDISQTRELVSEAEVLASMMQHGRAFVFSGADGSIDKLREHVAIRRNIVYWGLLPRGHQARPRRRRDSP